MCSCRLLNPIPRSLRSVMVAIRCLSVRPSRSRRQTTKVSPTRRWFMASCKPGRSDLAPLDIAPGGGFRNRKVFHRDKSRMYCTVRRALREQGQYAQVRAYRLLEQRAERKASFWAFNLFSRFGSLVLAVVAGYGERPMRIFGAYMTVVLSFASTY